MKRIISIFVVIVTLASILMAAPMSTSAATTAFDILTSSKYAKVYTLSSSGTTIPYTTSSLSNRGSVTYGKSSTAYISNSGDELYLMDVGTSNGQTWAKVSYPVGSKRAVAYIFLSAITSNNGSHTKTTSTGKFYCSYRKGVSTSRSYYVAKGDTVYLIATSGSSYQIMYPVSGGWRIGWCTKTDYEKYCGVAVTGVTLNKASATLNGKGKTVSLSATITPSKATDKTVTWKSSNTSVATVSSSGKVTAVSNGTATITATSSNGKKASAKITVSKVSATSVRINYSSFTLSGNGSSKTLSAVITPSNSTDKITWKSSNTAVATVNSSGKVTAKGNGTAIITATATSGKKATAKVTVKIVPATKVKLNYSSFNLSGKGSSKTLTYTLTPSTSTDRITWKSSNSSVATVNSSGKVTAVSNGTATITATATSGKKATVNVTVKNCSSYSISNNILTVNGVRMSEYPIGTKYTSSRYANVNGKSVDMYAWQCCAYARYIQTKLYGMHYFNSNSNFPNLSGSVNVKPTTTSTLKTLITSAGVGAHIRTGANTDKGKHSLIIIDVTSSGFTITDANSDGNNTIRIKTYTWSEYLNSNYGKSGFRYIEVYQK